MKDLIVILLIAFCAVSLGGCKDSKEERLSVVGTWNAVSLIEDVVYTDSGREQHNAVGIDYGSYIWELKDDGTAKIAGDDGGDYQWYDNGKNPNEYDNYIWDESKMKLLMGFADASKSSEVYDIINLSDNVMILKHSDKRLNLGDGEVLITRTLTFDRIK